MSEPPQDPYAPPAPGHGYAPPAPGYGYAPAPPPTSPTNGLGVAALVVGVIALLICWVPVIGVLAGLTAAGLGIGGWVRGRRTGGGVGLAVAGTVLGALAVVLGILATLLLFSLLGTLADCDQPGFTDDQVSQCIEDKLADRFG